MELIYVGICLILSAFFNGSETGLISLNRIHLHARLEDGSGAAKILEKMLKNSESVIGTFLICVNTFDVAAILNFTNFLVKILGNDPLIPLYDTLILTPVILILATLFPKVLFREFADGIMYRLAYICYGTSIVLYPFQFIFTRTTRLVLGIFGLKKRKSLFSKDEFNILLDMTTDKGMLKESEKEFIESIMNIKNVKAKEIMVPLIRMTCVERNDSVEVASALMLSTRHSRIPVFELRVDNMIGYVDNKSLLEAGKHDIVGKYIKETIFVPDLTPINQVLIRMQNKMTQMAFVVDEYGGVAGVITNQDIIAEIIGKFVEIREDWIQKEGNTYLVNGLMNIDELNEQLNLKIKKMDFETVAGYVLYKLGRIPETGASFDEGRLTFEVVSASNVRVKKIRISRKKRKEKKIKENLNADRGNQPA